MPEALKLEYSYPEIIWIFKNRSILTEYAFNSSGENVETVRKI
ncbi:hypothetical protein [Methanoplanus endosymbiosus]|nr:hypothetical protein [Methanoplanus endosymbiosus]